MAKVEANVEVVKHFKNFTIEVDREEFEILFALLGATMGLRADRLYLSFKRAYGNLDDGLSADELCRKANRLLGRDW